MLFCKESSISFNYQGESPKCLFADTMLVTPMFFDKFAILFEPMEAWVV